MGLILAIDQSTSATKVVLFDQRGNAFATDNAPHKQYYPRPGWVEHDPVEILNNTLGLIAGICRKASVSADDVKAIAITNQRETVVVWDKRTGKPVYPAIVWQCNRGKDLCNELKKAGKESMVREKTGLIIDPYFSAPGIAWILDNIEGTRENAERAHLLYGTMDSWLLWNLTDRQVHATDPTNACRTLLFNIHTVNWDEDLHGLFRIPMGMAPRIIYSDQVSGYTTAGGFFNRPVPVAGLMGDSHAALFGQFCHEPGLGKATFGTGSSIMINAGGIPPVPPSGLVCSVGYGMNESISYALEGNIHFTGATVSWLKDELGLIGNAEETEALATSIKGNDGVYFVPAFTGLGAPYWNPEARAMICGISRGTGKAHIARAALEAIAYQVKDLISLMTEGTGTSLSGLRLDGGPTKNRFLMQFQADMLQLPIYRNNSGEASAMGSAMMAGLAAGLLRNKQELKTWEKSYEEFHPEMSPQESERHFKEWKDAVKRTMNQ